jgi:hypothetical protein
MVFDRLSVLTIRIHYTAQAAGKGGAGYTDRLAVLEEQLAVLERAADALFDDVRTGRRRFVPYQSLKLYGAASAPPRTERPTGGTRRD